MVKTMRNKFSSEELEALVAICDTFLPSIEVPQHYQLQQSILHFYHTSASMAAIPTHVAEKIRKAQHPKTPLAILAIRLLATRIGTLILSGRKSLSPNFPYLQKFSEISLHKREEILHSWSASSFTLLRILYAALKIFIFLTFFTQVNEAKENPSWKAIGYCGPDPAFKPDPEKPKSEEERFGPLHKRIISFSQSKQTALHQLQISGFPTSQSPPQTAAFKQLNPSVVIRCDAVIVGSGSGGGVVAGVLAKAGYKVLVLEKGSYIARSNLTLMEGDAMDKMYLQQGILASEDMDVLILAGSTVGGGSTINWSASIRTPPHVRKEWSENHKLGLFESKIYDRALDAVCERMNVQLEIEEEGMQNEVLRRGCVNLGFPTEDIPRNAAADHYCGWCCLGCRDGRKQGAAETWLVDLAESKYGAILTDCEALKVITVKKGGIKRAAATGVVFRFKTGDGREEIGVIEARVTVAACGAISTPPLLRRSGLKNPNIGRNLHVHPVMMGWGHFPDSEKQSYEGGIITVMSKLDEYSDYSAVIQTPALHPGMFSALMPWSSGADMKGRMVKFSKTAHLFALARDKSCGEVKSESEISYMIGKFDEENLRKGMERVLRILAAAGAEEIGTHSRWGRVLKVKEASEEEFERFVKEESGRRPGNESAPMCSAHQMGSCRMGAEPGAGAVGPTGETWEVEGLFVADSSVFPTALGVNPMVTVMAIAYCTAQSVLEALANASK
ncbi:long-chain-alcohol oxidase FAO4A-like [Salvia splendens]|uniref:long-chain-alcohol oxidase FAO4A-like n=1 Tax=Salvia splendens TaxID=180675 RepID=UPI001C2748E4|nr:long-chain-alcohol oxidase FAO4A-like [Salvia splendens]